MSFGNNPARTLYQNLEVERGTDDTEIKATRGLLSRGQGDKARLALGVGKALSPSNKARKNLDVDRPSVRVAQHMSILKRKRADVIQAREAEQTIIQAKKDKKEKETPANDGA
jgi:hypothetical protein|tara:strand:- start:223 stop:561 length:339 start_codon:yes stop_codon:yes gene_type:complete